MDLVSVGFAEVQPARFRTRLASCLELTVLGFWFGTPPPVQRRKLMTGGGVERKVVYGKNIHLINVLGTEVRYHEVAATSQARSLIA